MMYTETKLHINQQNNTSKQVFLEMYSTERLCIHYDEMYMHYQ